MRFRFSQDIKTLLEKLANQSLTLGDILAQTSERGFSLVIGLLVLPFLFPMPPGLTGIFGSGSLILAIQMGLGRRSPWLPRKLAKFRIPHWLVLQLLKNLQRVTKISEKFTRPRLPGIANSRQFWKLTGFCIAWLNLLLMLPIPFTNPFPTLGILLLVIATLEADGLLICVGYILTILITLIFGLIGYFLWQTPTLLQNTFN